MPIGAKIFIVTAAETPPEIITVFKRGSNVSSTFSKIAAKFPDTYLKHIPIRKYQSCNRPSDNYYGGMFDGKIYVVRTGDSLSVYQYNINADSWICVQGKERSKCRTDVVGCAVNDVYVLFGGATLATRVELLQLKNTNVKLSSLFSSPIREHSSHKHTCFRQRLCSTQMPIDNLLKFWGHTITRVADNKVMLVGGRMISLGNKLAESCRVLLGEITENKRNVTWRKMESIKKARYGHVAFKMKESLYLVGGVDIDWNGLLSCVRFDLNESRWLNCRHSLPYPLERASVVVSDDESFAVITGGKKRNGHVHCASARIIVFSEENGFQELTNSSLLFPRDRHLSLLIN